MAGNFAVHRSEEYLGQEQADWLVETLAQVPSDYHVLIARHSFPDAGKFTPCAWTEVEEELVRYTNGDVVEIVPDIVDAWVKGTVLKKEYTPGVGESQFGSDLSVLSPISVNVDFSERGQGVFIGYIIGHEHMDWHGVCKRYPSQNIHLFAASANDAWQNYSSDLPRMKGTKAEDCLTVLTVDTQNRRVYMVRVGSNITNAMEERSCIVFNY